MLGQIEQWELCRQLCLNLPDIGKSYTKELGFSFREPIPHMENWSNKDRKVKLAEITLSSIKIPSQKIFNSAISALCNLMYDSSASDDELFFIFNLHPDPEQKMLEFWQYLLDYTDARAKTSDNFKTHREILNTTMKYWLERGIQS